MKSYTLSSIALLASVIPTSWAQTHTACNPLNTTGCPNMQALGSNATFYWNKTGIPTGSKVWEKQNQGVIDWSQDAGGEGAATFTIERSGDSPMVQSKFYMLFGRFESEALDEIDWEFLGTNTTHVLTNYFGKGNTTSFDRGLEFKMDPPQDDYHNYTIDWTKDRIEWWLDDKLLRTLVPADALDGKNYPQTPMNVRMGVWAGGDVANNDPGVVEWAGGKTDFKEGPFTMRVKTIYAQDYTKGAEYSWEDMDASGSWEKVKVINPEEKSTVLKEIEDPSGVRNNWKALSPGAKSGIIIGSLVVFGLLCCLMAFCCVKQRRAGRREHAALLAGEQKEAAELEEYKRQMQNGKFGFGSHTNRV
ncbi:concanavalin A-like lectin/glucanase domain-containing protein [Boeremia exigua]|uniref:concanavalin A-like lectin/glucanase domain-containing protein n=1 Tax=Boeremia exigua TaxID=749465 RepID=UPI001E8DB3A8|nr:concanavalin A-like lectin/glucanase domain-containing protein [Boeremia exigua]KAH6643189.1 concanavalin A-like lectin/glucanase domain-containing protein [Boeremia exigua]